MTYHFSRTKVFWVHLHVHHPCFLAATHLLLTLAFPPGKTQILTGRYIFPQLLGGSAVPSSVSLIISCVVCFFNVSRRQNMSPALFFFSCDPHNGQCEQLQTPLLTCRCLLGHKWEVDER